MGAKAASEIPEVQGLADKLEALWQARAEVFGFYEVAGIKRFKRKTDLWSISKDIHKLRDAVDKKMTSAGFSEEEVELARNYAIGYTAGQMPKNKKLRLVIKRTYELRDQLLEEITDFSPEFVKLLDDMRAREAEIKAISGQIYNAITEKLKAESAVTEEDARAWAEQNVFISEDVKKSMNRILYSPEHARKDFAEFYLFCGGTLPPVELIGSDKNGRAYSKGECHISISKDFDKTALFHEAAHLAEGVDPIIYTGSNAFIYGRAKGPQKHLGKGYDPDEYGLPDDFIDPYVGKIYRGDATEVYSVGAQLLANPEGLAWFMAKDPEHFNLMLGSCLRKSAFLAEKIKSTTKSVGRNLQKEKNETDRKRHGIKLWLKRFQMALKMLF